MAQDATDADGGTNFDLPSYDEIPIKIGYNVTGLQPDTKYKFTFMTTSKHPLPL